MATLGLYGLVWGCVIGVKRVYALGLRIRKLEPGSGFRMIIAGIPSALPSGHEDSDVTTFWVLL